MKRQILTEAKDRSRLNNECYKDIRDLIFIFLCNALKELNLAEKPFDGASFIIR